jgi:16S rRNA (guanine527-N7)-methyltransferase
MSGLSVEAQQSLTLGARSLGLALEPQQWEQLSAYVGLIERWNRTYNLTAVRDPAQMVTQHLLDSLAVVGPLRRHTAGARASLLDVGSGAGLPGIVLAIVCPELLVTCVDAVAKKAGFMRQVGVELGLRGFTARHARVEGLEPRPWELVISRAFASLADFTSLTESLLAPTGVWLAMKGRLPTDEIAGLPTEIDVFHVEQLSVPDLDAERCLIWLRRRRPA